MENHPAADMHWTAVITYSAIVLWMLPSAMRSDVAAVLVLAWCAGELFWSQTGESLPIRLYLLTDTCAIIAILSAWFFFIGERFPRWVLSMYIPIWAGYLLPYGDLQWYTLWVLTLGQFMAAGPWWMIRNHRDGRGLLAGNRPGFSLDRFRTVSHHIRAAALHIHSYASRKHVPDVIKSGAHSEIEWKG